MDVVRAFLDSCDDGFAQWASDYNGVVFLDDDTLGCVYASFCASYRFLLLVGDILSSRPFFCRIVLYAHPHWRCIYTVASVLGGSFGLQGLPLGFSWHLKLVMAGW